MSKTMGLLFTGKKTEMQKVKPFWFTFLLDSKMIFVVTAVLTRVFVRWERVVIDKPDSFRYNI